MGFTTLIIIYLRVGMNNKHQCKNISNYGRNNVELKMILTLKPSIGK